jgi:hypothetical protein
MFFAPVPAVLASETLKAVVTWFEASLSHQRNPAKTTLDEQHQERYRPKTLAFIKKLR